MLSSADSILENDHIGSEDDLFVILDQNLTKENDEIINEQQHMDQIAMLSSPSLLMTALALTETTTTTTSKTTVNKSINEQETKTSSTSIIKKRTMKDLPKPIILQAPTFNKNMNKMEPKSTKFVNVNEESPSFFTRFDLEKLLQSISNDELNDRMIQKKIIELKYLIDERRKKIPKPIDYHFSLPLRYRQKPVDLHLPYDYTYQEILNKPYPMSKRH